MLADLKIDMDALKEFESSEYPYNPHLIEKGIIYDDERFFFKTIREISFDDEFKYFAKKGIDKVQFGVADNIEQIKEYYADEIKDPNEKFAISLRYIYQDKGNAGQYDGWRWCKWGPYIGTLNSQCDYLDDEDFGDDFSGYVICFQLFHIP